MKKPVHSNLHRQKSQYEPLLFNTEQMNQSINKVPGINNKTYTITINSLLVSSSNPKIFYLHRKPPTPVILREGEVA